MVYAMILASFLGCMSMTMMKAANPNDLLVDNQKGQYRTKIASYLTNEADRLNVNKIFAQNHTLACYNHFRTVISPEEHRKITMRSDNYNVSFAISGFMTYEQLQVSRAKENMIKVDTHVRNALNAYATLVGKTNEETQSLISAIMLTCNTIVAKQEDWKKNEAMSQMTKDTLLKMAVDLTTYYKGLREKKDAHALQEYQTENQRQCQAVIGALNQVTQLRATLFSTKK
jgi:hypothetical protein